MRYYLFLILLLLVFAARAQEKKRILVKHADILISESTDTSEVNILRGNVIFEHDTALLFCDSAYMYEATNSLDAFGNVHVFLRDSLDLFGDVLFYDGNAKLAEFHYNVQLIDKETTLYTEHLYYDRNINRAHYPDSGRIVDGANRLTSKTGYYYADPREFQFRKDVVLTDPDYVLTSDTLVYQSTPKIALIKGPTHIHGKDRYMYCEDGWYDTKNEISQLRTNVFTRNKDRTLSSDSLYYRKQDQFARAFRNVIMRDTTKKITLTGEFAEYCETGGYTYVTDSACALFVEKGDTLFLHADTLRLTFDTARVAKFFYAFNKAKFFRNDMQGMCDSVVYSYHDSTITMFKQPVLWFEANQLTADSIILYVANKQIDSMALYNTAFIAQQDDTASFNQVKGRDMHAYFVENKLNRINVTGNSESVYYVREEDKNLIGINNTIASNMSLVVVDNKINDIYYYVQPEGGLYPAKDYPADKLKLKGFNWFGERRPNSRIDIFTW
jgi:lipopolysaccharide export system protein LptA